MKLLNPLASVALAGILVLTGCGGGSDSPILEGVAAVGDPIVGGTVSIQCAGGSTMSTTTSAGGVWQVGIVGQTLPCAVRVSGGTINGGANSTAYHSIALTLGTVNITPLTDLIVANLVGNAPGTWFAGASGTALQGINAGQLATALATVRSALGLTGTLNGVDPLTAHFVAVSGNLLDDVLQALAGAGSSHAALLALAAGSNFSAPPGFDFASAYAAVIANTGGSTTSCGAGETALSYSGTTPFANGQVVCFAASSTSLAFTGQTLGDPTLNNQVMAPFSAYTFAGAGASYEVVFNAGALYEINVLDASGNFVGQFAPVTTPPAGSVGNLEVQVTVAGVTSSINVGAVPPPSSQGEFCSAVSTDSTFAGIAASGGGSLAIASCSFSGNVGTISANLTVAGLPVAIPYTVRYNYL